MNNNSFPSTSRILFLHEAHADTINIVDCLTELEAFFAKRYKRVNFRLAEYFDLIVGKNTSALIAAGLAYKLPVSKVKTFISEKEVSEDLEKLYEEMDILSKTLETDLVIEYEEENTGKVQELNIQSLDDITQDWFAQLQTNELLIVQIGNGNSDNIFGLDSTTILDNSNFLVHLRYTDRHRMEDKWFQDTHFPKHFDVELKTDLANFDLEGFLRRDEGV